MIRDSRSTGDGAAPAEVIELARGRRAATVRLDRFGAHAQAALMLHLARGQLNRAYRIHGLEPPDPVRAPGRVVMDDPMATPLRPGVTAAVGRWREQMPAALVGPVLDILHRTGAALSRHGEGNAEAVAAAGLAARLLEEAADSLAPRPSPAGGARLARNA